MYILILILLHFSFTWDTVDEMLSVVTVFKGSDVSLFGQLFEYQGGCSVSWSFLLIKVLTANHGVLSRFKESPGDNTMDQKWGVITVSELNMNAKQSEWGWKLRMRLKVNDMFDVMT